MMRMDVLYQFNEGYAPFAGVSMTSLLENCNKLTEVCLHILGENLTKHSIDRFMEFENKYQCKVVLYDTTEIINQMKDWGLPSYRGSYAANMRLFIPKIVSQEIERILYLDADTVVVEDVAEFYSMDMQAAAIAMALDSLGASHKLSIGLSEQDYYYNSGVILFDMKQWVRYDLTNRIIEHIEQGNTNYPNPDQDLLNVICRNYVKLIDNRYNLQPVHLAFSNSSYYNNYSHIGYYTNEQLGQAVNNPVIYHFFRFLGEFPWHKDSLHPDTKIFDLYLKDSPWKDYMKQPVEDGIVNHVERVLYRILPRSLFLKIFCIAHAHYIESNRQTRS